MRLLVTGGAGYIGSHFVSEALRQGGYEIVVIDDLSTGLSRRIPDTADFACLDIADSSSLPELVEILSRGVDAVIHFAAKKVVSDSVTNPEEYFRSNIGGTINLLTAMREVGVKKIVFSSSAAVYGEPDNQVVYENTPCRPINPYGQSKLVSEIALDNASHAWGLEAISLRYFNVAGALNSCLADTTTTNLMPAIRDRLTQGEKVSIFGEDYETADGTCVRDYIHILDLVDAHLVALHNSSSRLDTGLQTFNVGTGRGSSVLEIVNSFRSIPGVELEYEYAPRRPGDPAALTANTDKISTQLSWGAKFSTRDIVQSVIDHPPLSI